MAYSRRCLVLGQAWSGQRALHCSSGDGMSSCRRHELAGEETSFWKWRLMNALGVSYMFPRDFGQILQ